MTSSQLLFLLVVLCVVFAIAGLGLALFAPLALRGRLRHFLGSAEPSQLEAGGWTERVAAIAKPLSKLSVPEEGWEKSNLRTRFMNAGWRNPSAPTLYFASKTGLALLLPALVAPVSLVYPAALGGTRLMALLLFTAAFGYYLPNIVLERLVQRRRREIFETIPDALDLLTVCVEAGLSLERAMVKVAAEIHIKSLALAQELQIVLMEMRAGFTKEKALRNFALRSGVEDVDTLVAMLIQSERFGTSVGDSLRVHSENLRYKRRMMAEECAAKIGLKLLFPLIFCIFPTLMMVLLGPAAIQLMQTLPNLPGMQ
ncbi:type II secretion system F family protein [Massilia sp. IC2-477]|uniref:type II secretion system F family protein n=1 Tax=unclassified Massilia TaxID=2609279 RepID=UPI001D10C8A8|nr:MULTISPECIES: type II secretion system F family protein [unclassified Massilia]MCC2955096.1 type II secretion system F family protein [Massilia sp. IC2-477]MCC2974685.1 type II secretion system F family protein [Massilia sp. IC2-476]